ncbi:hypothetical protein FISHEDRAFT_59003, partial [Fistulina hepatica ATCC 64428]
KDDLQKHASQYTVGKSPTTFMTAKGDFSPHGGLYAFTEEKEAIFWGNSFQMMDPKTPFYVVTYHYTPTGTMKRFQSADAQWLDWIQKCNAGKMPATRLPQAVEGPISVGKNAGKSKLDGHDLIQIAIVDEAALRDVRVAKIEGYCYDKAWQGNPKGTPTPKPFRNSIKKLLYFRKCVSCNFLST